jgi:hypothetical protein
MSKRKAGFRSVGGAAARKGAPEWLVETLEDGKVFEPRDIQTDGGSRRRVGRFGYLFLNK